MSEKDASLAARPCEVIPNGVDLARFSFQPEPPGLNVLFVGSLRHFPNAAAFRFLWQEIWPLVLALCPQARLTVVAGPDAQSHWAAFTSQPQLPAHPSLTLHQFVADVAPLYTAANLVVIPTLFSAGTNLKALEAMSAGRAIVSTPSGVGGLGLSHGESVLIASTAEELAQAIVALLSDPEYRERLARSASLIAQQNFGWGPLGARQRALWRSFQPAPLSIRLLAGAPSQTPWDLSAYPPESTWLAELDGSPLAYLASRPLTGGEFEILNLAVEPDWLRHGIATRLLEHAFLTHPGTWFLEVRESNEAARALYAKLGFQPVGRRPRYYQAPVEDALILKRC
jgi:ribosomal protein S18 acetylase RimI-like enzyme